MNIGIFLNSSNHERYTEVLMKFAIGMEKFGDSPKIITGFNNDYYDLSIFFGSWKDKKTDHHLARNHIIKNTKNFICIETPIIGRKEVKDVMEDDSFRIGVNGY